MRVCLFFLCAFVGSVVSASAGFEEGLSAFKARDYKTAVREWTPLAEDGSVSAQYNLAQMYRAGLLGEPDYVLAAFWYRKAAEQGMAVAKYNLGLLIADGLIPEQALGEGTRLIVSAATDGLVDAQYTLGVGFATAPPPHTDLLRARLWFEVAASSGSQEARSQLAEIVKYFDANMVAQYQQLLERCTSVGLAKC